MYMTDLQGRLRLKPIFWLVVAIVVVSAIYAYVAVFGL